MLRESMRRMRRGVMMNNVCDITLLRRVPTIGLDVPGIFPLGQYIMSFFCLGFTYSACVSPHMGLFFYKRDGKSYWVWLGPSFSGASCILCSFLFLAMFTA